MFISNYLMFLNWFTSHLNFLSAHNYRLVGWFYFRDESGQDFAIPESEFLAKFKPVAGGNGDKGDPGKDGVGIKTITASQEGGVVTLTIEMTDGTQQTPSFTLPSA